MARQKDEVTPTEEVPAETPAKPKVAPEIRKQARLLFEIASLYRLAGQALNAGDDIAYNKAANLITKYQGLFDALSQASAEDITAEGLAAINEM